MRKKSSPLVNEKEEEVYSPRDINLNFPNPMAGVTVITCQSFQAQVPGIYPKTRRYE